MPRAGMKIGELSPKQAVEDHSDERRRSELRGSSLSVSELYRLIDGHWSANFSASFCG
jgi:hypothetical protein